MQVPETEEPPDRRRKRSGGGFFKLVFVGGLLVGGAWFGGKYYRTWFGGGEGAPAAAPPRSKPSRWRRRRQAGARTEAGARAGTEGPSRPSRQPAAAKGQGSEAAAETAKEDAKAEKPAPRAGRAQEGAAAERVAPVKERDRAPRIDLKSMMAPDPSQLPPPEPAPKPAPPPPSEPPAGKRTPLTLAGPSRAFRRLAAVRVRWRRRPGFLISAQPCRLGCWSETAVPKENHETVVGYVQRHRNARARGGADSSMTTGGAARPPRTTSPSPCRPAPTSALTAGDGTTRSALLGQQADSYTLTRVVTGIVNGATGAVAVARQDHRQLSRRPACTARHGRVGPAQRAAGQERLAPDGHARREARVQLGARRQAEGRRRHRVRHDPVRHAHARRRRPRTVRSRATAAARSWSTGTRRRRCPITTTVGVATFTYRARRPAAVTTIDVDFKGIQDDPPDDRALQCALPLHGHAGRGRRAASTRAKRDDFPIRTPSSSAKEDFTIHSRWQETGTGRTDYQLTGGDVATAAAVGAVTVSECWDVELRSSTYRECVVRSDSTELGRRGELLVRDRRVPVAFALRNLSTLPRGRRGRTRPRASRTK